MSQGSCCDSSFILSIVLFSFPVLLNGILSPILDCISPDLCYTGEQYIKRSAYKSVYLLACLFRKFGYLSLPEHCFWEDLGRCKLEVLVK